MKLPILALGHSILKHKCDEVTNSFPHLEKLIEDLWETMQKANGCGLAAPQIGLAISLFIVDSKTIFESLQKNNRLGYFDQSDKGIMETFINAKIIDHSEEFWEEDEGCLSLPNLSQKVKRHWTITIEYCNQNFEKRIQSFSGTTARIIQHEYDHKEGILYLDHLEPLTNKIMDSKLKKIIKGQVNPNYLMKFVSK